MDLPPVEINFAEPTQVMHIIEASNPLLMQNGPVRFDAIKPRHFIVAFEVLEERVLVKLETIESEAFPNWENIMIPLEEIEEDIHQIVGPMEHLKMVMDSAEMRLTWAQIEPLLTKLKLRIEQSTPLFEAFQTIKENDEWKRLSPIERRILENRLLKAELAGIGLKGKAKERFNQLTFELSALQNTFNSTLLDAIKHYSFNIKDRALLEGVPFETLQMMSDAYNQKRGKEDAPSTASKGPWRASLDSPIYLPILRSCENREIREKLYRAQIRKAGHGDHDNRENIIQQLRLRHELATLLGFNSYVELSVKKKMAKDSETVKSFLFDLRDAAYEIGEKDLKEIKDFAKASGFAQDFMPWDYPYWAEKFKEKKFALSTKEIKNYFPLPKVLEGLFSLCQKLFGITVCKSSAPIWHLDVRYYALSDASGKEFAGFYLDPYVRTETKRGGAWMESCRNRSYNQKKLQNPIAYICCNSSPPVGNEPAFLSFGEVQTIFHEFGHALQHMLTEVDYASVSGTNGIEWDSVEMVSQFMENWCYDPKALKMITAHRKTGEPIPDDLIQKLLKTRNFQAGIAMLRQLKLGITDFTLHDHFNPDGLVSPTELWQKIANATSPLSVLEEDEFLCSFHHIFGGEEYAAGYYSYKWAEVMSADAFQAFEENKEEISDIGKRFRETFLALGGSVHPLEVFISFRGREPLLEPLLMQNGFIADEENDLD